MKYSFVTRGSVTGERERNASRTGIYRIRTILPSEDISYLRMQVTPVKLNWLHP